MSEWNGNPRKRHYLVVLQGNEDGTIDYSFESPMPFDTLDDAIKAAKEQAADDGGEFFIIECRPVKRVWRGKVKVRDVEEEK